MSAPAQDMSSTSQAPGRASAVPVDNGAASPPSRDKAAGPASSEDSRGPQTPSPMQALPTSEGGSPPLMAPEPAAAAPATRAALAGAGAPLKEHPGPFMAPEAVAPEPAGPDAASAGAGIFQSSADAALTLAATAAATDGLATSAADGSPGMSWYPCIEHQQRPADQECWQSSDTQPA